MKFPAVISRTTTDIMKSKQLSPQIVQLVLDVYMSPQEWAEVISKLYDKEFVVELKDAS